MSWYPLTTFENLMLAAVVTECLLLIELLRVSALHANGRTIPVSALATVSVSGREATRSLTPTRTLWETIRGIREERSAKASTPAVPQPSAASSSSSSSLGGGVEASIDGASQAIKLLSSEIEVEQIGGLMPAQTPLATHATLVTYDQLDGVSDCLPKLASESSNEKVEAVGGGETDSNPSKTLGHSKTAQNQPLASPTKRGASAVALEEDVQALLRRIEKSRNGSKT